MSGAAIAIHVLVIIGLSERAAIAFAIAIAIDPCVFHTNGERQFALESCNVTDWPQNLLLREDESDRIVTFTLKNVTLTLCRDWVTWLSDWQASSAHLVDTFDIEASEEFIRCLPDNLTLIVARLDGGPKSWLGLQAMSLGNEMVESRLIGGNVQIKVRTLSLQELELTRIPAINISVTDSLMLSDNRIARIATHDFDLMNLTTLKNLWLDANVLCYIEASAFRQMAALEHLDLSDNQLARLSIRFYVHNFVEQHNLPFNIIWNTTQWTYAQNCCGVVRKASECKQIELVEIGKQEAGRTTPSVNIPNLTSSGPTSMLANHSIYENPKIVTNPHWYSEQVGVLAIVLFIVALVFTGIFVSKRRRTRRVSYRHPECGVKPAAAAAAAAAAPNHETPAL